MAHVRKLGKKRWQARYRGPDGRERARNFTREGDARRFAASVETDKSRGLWNDPRLGKTPLEEWAQEWLGARLNSRGATRARDESLVKNHVIGALGDVPLVRLDKLTVQRWVTRLSESGLAPTTVRECYRLLGAIMAEAVDHKMIPESPCRRVSLPRVKRVEARFLSPAEVEVLVESFDATHRPLIYCAVYLGLRWEELAGLKRQYLDLLRRQVKIVGTIERVGGTYRYAEETKSDASRRTLWLPGFLVEILARHLEGAPESEYVFSAAEGGHLRYDNFRCRVWNPTVVRSGLPRLTFHELRHTAAAIMIDQSADPLQVQRRLGHNDIRTTLRYYGHLFPNREDDLNDALEKVYREARAGSLADSSRTGVVALEAVNVAN